MRCNILHHATLYYIIQDNLKEYEYNVPRANEFITPTNMFIFNEDIPLTHNHFNLNVSTMVPVACHLVEYIIHH